MRGGGGERNMTGEAEVEQVEDEEEEPTRIQVGVCVYIHTIFA
jgi:hypothetical protein